MKQVVFRFSILALLVLQLGLSSGVRAAWEGIYTVTRGGYMVAREDVTLSGTAGRIRIEGTHRRVDGSDGLRSLVYRLEARAPTMALSRFVRTERGASGKRSTPLRVTVQEKEGVVRALVSSVTTSTIDVETAVMAVERDLVGPWVVALSSYDRASRGLQTRSTLVLPDGVAGTLRMDYRGEDVAPGRPDTRLRLHDIHLDDERVRVWSDILGRVVRLSWADGRTAWLDGWFEAFQVEDSSIQISSAVSERRVAVPLTAGFAAATVYVTEAFSRDAPCVVLLPDPLASNDDSLLKAMVQELAMAGMKIVVIHDTSGFDMAARAAGVMIRDLLKRDRIDRDRVVVGGMGDGVSAALCTVIRAPDEDFPGRVAALFVVDPRDQPLGSAIVEGFGSLLVDEGIDSSYRDQLVDEVRHGLVAIDDGHDDRPWPAGIDRGMALLETVVLRRAHLRGVISVDPVNLASRVTVPTMIIGGEGFGQGFLGRRFDELHRGFLFGEGGNVVVRRRTGEGESSPADFIGEVLGSWLSGLGIYRP